jgi:Flp pilus assembly protein TadG
LTIHSANRWKDNRASAIIEFALISFMFVMVLLGIVEMGRMVLVYTTIANAARAGARYAITHGSDRTGSGTDGPSGPGTPCTCTQIQTVVQNFASSGLLTPSNVTVTVNYPDTTNSPANKPGSKVQVIASYPYDPFVSFFNSRLSVTFVSSSEGVITF